MFFDGYAGDENGGVNDKVDGDVGVVGSLANLCTHVSWACVSGVATLMRCRCRSVEAMVRTSGMYSGAASALFMQKAKMGSRNACLSSSHLDL